MTKTKEITSNEEKRQSRKLLQVHFSEYAWTERELDFEADFLSADWLTAGSLVEAIDRKRVLERLKKIESLTDELWKEYHALPLMIRGHNTENLWQRIMDLKYDLTGRTPFVSPERVFQSVYDRRMPRKNGVLALMRERAASFFGMHHNARDEELARKVHLVRHANDLWGKYARKRPPLKPSPSTAYYRFIADMIGVAGKEWSVDATVRAFRLYSQRKDADR